jgi:hypothetical protein
MVCKTETCRDVIFTYIMTFLDTQNSVHYEGVILCKQTDAWPEVTSRYISYGTQIKNYALKGEASVDARNYGGRIKLLSRVMEHLLQQNLQINDKH